MILAPPSCGTLSAIMGTMLRMLTRLKRWLPVPGPVYSQPECRAHLRLSLTRMMGQDPPGPESGGGVRRPEPALAGRRRPALLLGRGPDSEP
jgi:hypothetical protein